MSRELDVQVARVMGYFTEVFNDVYLYATNEETYHRYLKDNCLGGDTLNGSFVFCRRLPFYSTDIAAARTMEDWIEERGFQKRYGHAMENVLIEDGRLSNLYEINAWHFIHATPEQRCLAFLAAMGK